MSVVRFHEHLSEVAPFWRYSECMPSIQIKHVPPEVHRALQHRARLAGKSMQEFLSDELVLIAQQEVVDEIFEEARRSGIQLEPGQVAKVIREERERRDRP